jgi:transcriptional activator of cad operon
VLRIGDWSVNPVSCEISREGETARVEVRTMRLLVCLAERAGEVVSIDDLLTQVWPDVTVSQDSVYQAVASLRRLLGDDPKQPVYIATVPRLGYRLVAAVSSMPATIDAPAAAPRASAAIIWVAGTALVLAFVAAVVFYSRNANDIHTGAGGLGPEARKPISQAAVPPPQKSIAVLPFADLTEEMNQEPFADGMTTELIDRLSKTPGFRVHAPTPSLKGKRDTIAATAKMLGVEYVLDGSVRKAGARLRVAARLLRASDEYVVWSESYDRSLDDILMVQDDIAAEVAKALKTSITAAP